MSPRVLRTEPAAPRYSRHVAAVFSKLGCNSGGCHGAVKGQNGFRLTLFGADTALDHGRLLREFGGRRLDFQTPASSLLLLKATGQASHGGGKRLDVGSAEYEMLRRWIAMGATLDALEQSRVTRLHVTPTEHTGRPGESYALRVEATFADGSREDVTRLCSFESLDKHVATITSRPGACAGSRRHRLDGALHRGAHHRPGAGATTGQRSLSRSDAHNFIDKHILAKLRR